MKSPNSLFAYGTLMDAAMRLKVLGRDCPVRLATLPAYARKTGKWPYLVPGHGAKGLLLLNLSEKDFNALDAYEDVAAKLYSRARCEVQLSGGETAKAWVYFAILSNWPPAWK